MHSVVKVLRSAVAGWLSAQGLGSTQEVPDTQAGTPENRSCFGMLCRSRGSEAEHSVSCFVVQKLVHFSLC